MTPRYCLWRGKYNHAIYVQVKLKLGFNLVRQRHIPVYGLGTHHVI